MTAPSLLRSPSSWVYWLTIALVVKGAFFGWYLTQTYMHDLPGFWGQSNGDMLTYISPVESLLNHGGFKTDDRMPGYPAVYLALRFVFSQAGAANATILLQLLLSVVSVYTLGWCGRLLFGADRAFYWAYFIYLLSPFVSVFDAYFLTESFAASASIFFLYCFLMANESARSLPVRRWVWLVVAGAWLAWSVFLKPAHLPLLAIPVAIWAVRWLRGRLRFGQLARYSLLFLLPFLLADGAWMVRNYREYRQVIPLLKNPWYAAAFWPTNYFDMMPFFQAYGEDFSYWFPNTGIRWFMGWRNNNFLPPVRWYETEHLAPPPDYIYTSQFNRDSLTETRGLYYQLGNNHDLDSAQYHAIEIEVGTRLQRYARSIRAEHPLIYYGWAPLRYTANFLNGTWGYHFLDDIVVAQWPRWLLRFYHYLFVLVPGLLGLFLLTIRGWKDDDRLLVLPMALVYCVLVYVVVLRHPETRYLAPFYPFLVLCAVGLFLRMFVRRPIASNDSTAAATLETVNYKP